MSGRQNKKRKETEDHDLEEVVITKEDMKLLRPLLNKLKRQKKTKETSRFLEVGCDEKSCSYAWMKSLSSS